MAQAPSPLITRAQRFPVNAPLHYRSSGMKHWLKGKTVNISRTGILFRSDETVPPGSILDVRVDLPTHASLACRCTVVRTEPSLLAVQINHHSLVHS